MSRVQLALNVDDIDTAVTFYSKLFNTQPAKVKPGYANFAVAEPPLKLILRQAKWSGPTRPRAAAAPSSCRPASRSSP